MITLAIDTALQQCSVAIVQQTKQHAKTLAREVLSLEKGHAEHLAPLTNRVLEEAAIKIASLDRIVVTKGPGGFTGVRAGLSFARGLVLGGDIEIIGVSTTAALAGSYAALKDNHKSCYVAPIIDARREEVYCALYRINEHGTLKEMIAPVATSPSHAKTSLINALEHNSCALIGTGVGVLGEYPSFFTPDTTLTQINPVALACHGSTLPIADHPAQPLYLRAPDAKPSAKSLFSFGR